MSIEINNESGAEVDETALTRLAASCSTRSGKSPAELSSCCSTSRRWRLHQQWMDLPDDRRHGFPMDGPIPG